MAEKNLNQTTATDKAAITHEHVDEIFGQSRALEALASSLRYSETVDVYDIPLGGVATLLENVAAKLMEIHEYADSPHLTHGKVRLEGGRYVFQREDAENVGTNKGQ